MKAREEIDILYRGLEARVRLLEGRLDDSYRIATGTLLLLKRVRDTYPHIYSEVISEGEVERLISGGL